MKGFMMVEMTGIEPATSALRKQRSPKLSYIPTITSINQRNSRYNK